MNLSSKNYRLGVDIGGTFTDLVMMDEATGELQLIKMSSTPDDPSTAFMNVIERVLSESRADAADAAYLVHGTTVATNTIIEGKGARTAFLTTAGFRDIFEIARQIRPVLYDLFCKKPPPLVPRYLCFEANERLDARGNVTEALDEDSVRAATRRMAGEAVESVVVCMLHAYVNPAHEQRAGEIIREELPGVSVSLSSDLCPEMREYFRASTTAVNALVMPVMARYLQRLENRLEKIGVGAELHLMTSSGGIISSAIAQNEPVHLIESGPAAGVTAAAYIGSTVGIKDIISFDMGGTTAKLGLVINGSPSIAPHFEVGAAAGTDNRSSGYPVRTPVVDLVEIGAGGGSIAWVDAGGALRVGPRSGGADPGPACYDKGQESPCITDAHLVLGRINPDYFIGGEQVLRLDLAEHAVGKLADDLSLGLHETASGILEIADANMVGAIRTISVQRGFDPREFVLVGFGGAGPLHANALAANLGIPRVLIPMSPGVTSATGLLVGDIKHDYVQAALHSLDDVRLEALDDSFKNFENRGCERLVVEGIADADMHFIRRFDMRYKGQSYELTVDCPEGGATRDSLAAAFVTQHRRVYGYATEDEPIELVNIRFTAVGAIRRPTLRQLESGGLNPAVALKDEREVYFMAAGGHVTCPIYDRYKLQNGNCLAGPAIVEEYDSTVVIHPGYTATVDGTGHILIEVNR
jgi:N-methylhydantoinase A